MNNSLKLILLIVLISITISALSDSRKTYVIFVDQVGKTETFFDKYPQGATEIVIASRAHAKSKNIQLELNDLEDLYVAVLDDGVSAKYKKGKLPSLLGKVGDYLIFQGLKKSEVEHYDHMYGLKLAKVSQEEKTFKTDTKTVIKFTEKNSEAYLNFVKSQFNGTYLKDKLEFITGVKPISVNNQNILIKERGSKAGRNAIRAYLKQELELLGFKTWTHTYNSSSAGINFVAQKDGTEADKFVVISAHIDSVGNAGADDDGTGVAALIATAKVFSTLTHQYGLRILGFDEEEDGLVGSGAYMSSLAKSGEIKNLVAAIHYDMIGYDSNSDGKFHILHCNENSSNKIEELMSSTIKGSAVPLSNINACRRRSDHIRYWQYGRPAVMAIEIREKDSDVNPCYHAKCDKVETINFDYFANIAQVGAVALMQMANVELKTH